MRAYVLETGEFAVVITKVEATHITDPNTNNPVQSKTTKQMMALIKSCFDK